MNKPLNSTWSLWFHSVTDTSWNKSSYKELYSVSTLYELKTIHDVIQKHHLQNGMFFMMRDDIFPTWEDPDNREGCCISFKIGSDRLKEQWTMIVNQVVGEDIVKDTEQTMEINGISVAPKKEFNIIKIWLRKNVTAYPEILKEYGPYFTKDKALIRKHDLS